MITPIFGKKMGDFVSNNIHWIIYY